MHASRLNFKACHVAIGRARMSLSEFRLTTKDVAIDMALAQLFSAPNKEQHTK